MRAEALAPGKLILFGEYAVLEGAPAIVAAVDRCVAVTVVTRDAGPWTVETDAGDGPWSLVVDDPDGDRLTVVAPAGAGEAPWIVRAIEETQHRAWSSLAGLPPLAIQVRSAALFEGRERRKLGLGSSAAVVVALGAALHALRAQLAGEAYDPFPPEAFADALDVHHTLQRGGSGADVAASFHGGVLAFRRGARGAAHVEPLGMPADLHVACVWTGQSTSTTSFLERVQACKAEQPAAYGECLARLRGVAEDALLAFRSGDGRRLVALADAYHHAMATLGDVCGLPVVSEVHDAVAKLAHDAGATYKPSGAGGGDVGLLLAATEESLAESTRAVRAAGHRILDIAFCETGVTILPS